MNELFQVFEFIWVYIDDLLVLNNCDWDDNHGNMEHMIFNIGKTGWNVTYIYIWTNIKGVFGFLGDPREGLGNKE